MLLLFSVTFMISVKPFHPPDQPSYKFKDHPLRLTRHTWGGAKNRWRKREKKVPPCALASNHPSQTPKLHVLAFRQALAIRWDLVGSSPVRGPEARTRRRWLAKIFPKGRAAESRWRKVRPRAPTWYADSVESSTRRRKRNRYRNEPLGTHFLDWRAGLYYFCCLLQVRTNKDGGCLRAVNQHLFAC